MNVKAGDMAIIVGSDHDNHGRIVDVLRPYHPIGETSAAWWVRSTGSPLNAAFGTALEGWNFDYELRPIPMGREEESTERPVNLELARQD
jgi:hypothetical protein